MAQNTTTKKRISKKQREALRKKKRQEAFIRGILLIVFTGICILMFISLFVPPLAWLNKVVSFMFGVRKYIMPFVLIFIAWYFVFEGWSSALLKKLLSGILFFFAAGGIFSAMIGRSAGGMLGQLNYLITFKLLGKAGTCIVSVILILISLLIFFEFSFVDFMKEKKQQREEDEQEIERRRLMQERRKISEQKKSMARQEAKQKQNARVNAENERRRRELEERRKKNEAIRRQAENADRFAPVVGIGDTKITGETAPVAPALKTEQNPVEENAKSFRDKVNSFEVDYHVPPTEKKKKSDDQGITLTNLTRRDPEETEDGDSGNRRPVYVRSQVEPKIRISAKFDENQDDDAYFFSGDDQLPTSDQIIFSSEEMNLVSENLSNLSFDALGDEEDETDESTDTSDEAYGTGAAEPAAESPESLSGPEIVFDDSADLFGQAGDENTYEKVSPDTETAAMAAAKYGETRVVETANGKRITIETDGDHLAGKERIIGQKGANEIPYEIKDKKTLQNETDNHNTADNSVAETIEANKEIEPAKEYEFPPIELLKKGESSSMTKTEIEAELRKTADKLRETLHTFGVNVNVTNISQGPAVTRYEIQPEMGVKVSKIVSLTDDIKLNLAAADIRMEAPIPGKSAIGIEIPNKSKQSVPLRDILETDDFANAKSKLAFAAGRDIEGNTIVANIQKMPHVLVAGATGSGKSVCINSIIMSILYHAKPTEVKMIMVDPKVVELSVYNDIPHLLLPVVTDPKQAAGALNWAVAEMEQRYQSFADYSVRGIEGFNELIDRESPADAVGNPLKKMPQILIIVDELADLMMVAPGDVETAICRLAQKARAAGIHLVLATQRPSVDVITGLIKANIPSRIAFAVSSGTDSRTILDMVGAEKLLGQGDMLYAPAGASKPIRVQGTFVSDDEVKRVVDYIKAEGNVAGGVKRDIDLKSAGSGSSSTGGSGAPDRDEFFAEAGRLIIDKQKASIGMLQRAFKLGFNRAARIVDQLYEAGVVGEEEGTKPRKVIMTMEEFENFLREQE